MTQIGGSAFEGCSSLESIDIPNSVTEIWYSAFEGCSALKEVHCRRIENIKEMEVNKSAFEEEHFDECVLYVPDGTLLEYRHHPVWGKFKQIEIYRTE